ncbi:hypothetical protein EQG49_11895 [Periweissella cryptocerci]|uniref:Uncharacterized protein n=1 Tax=Periweissella cryptocerci TaxID=2506420 RepID=A0A4P6YWD8_9LACO|nr:hypothetical protein [Periweissella cryptocerci]QBO37106.1 hypothetical protein EQG49_11895 [Periweissella cryptocerci]
MKRFIKIPMILAMLLVMAICFVMNAPNVSASTYNKYYTVTNTNKNSIKKKHFVHDGDILWDDTTYHYQAISSLPYMYFISVDEADWQWADDSIEDSSGVIFPTVDEFLYGAKGDYRVWYNSHAKPTAYAYVKNSNGKIVKTYKIGQTAKKIKIKSNQKLKLSHAKATRQKVTVRIKYKNSWTGSTISSKKYRINKGSIKQIKTVRVAGYQPKKINKKYVINKRKTLTFKLMPKKAWVSVKFVNSRNAKLVATKKYLTKPYAKKYIATFSKVGYQVKKGATYRINNKVLTVKVVPKQFVYTIKYQLKTTDVDDGYNETIKYTTLEKGQKSVYYDQRFVYTQTDVDYTGVLSYKGTDYFPTGNPLALQNYDNSKYEYHTTVTGDKVITFKFSDDGGDWDFQ